MPFRFYIVFDLLPRSFVFDKWVNAVFESNDIFTSDCIGDGATVESVASEVLNDTLVQRLSKVDKRLGRIEVLSVDLEETDGGSAVVGPESEMSSDVTTKVTRATIPSSPRARFLGNGVIHLYRDGEEETTDVVTHNQAGVENSQTPVLAILAVPGYMTASDLLGFVGKDCRQTISHLRMLRSSAPNRYMVLMKFREKSHADKFYQDYNCKMFNSMEPETCHVVYINSIRFHKSTFPEFPYLLDDEFTPLAEHQISTDKRRNRATSVAGPSVLAKPAPPPTRALRELPTCPVCLERMDSSVTGLLTIICQHTFHCQCLSKWGDNSCPVCRYSQKKDHQSQLSEPNQCSSCGAVQNLWICLICGNIGCGRYDEAHAFQHYMESDHVYAMDLESQRVWDYAGDGYVHRLIQNQSDGKLVELPSLAASSADHTGGDSCDENSSGDYVPREKLDSIGMEYTYLLTSQLESQRAYFEDKIAEAADKASAALEKAEKAERDAAEAQARLSRAKMENDELKGIVPHLEKEHEKLKRKSETLQAVSKKLEKEWREEKSMNESMLQKLEFLMQEKAQKEKEIEELKDQLRDVMLYLDAQQKFQGMEEDVQQGMVSVRESPSSKKKKGRGKK
ncbi:BRCA1-associated protein 2-domain-containing protein [Lipomyces tetrasporus]|uniref:BRCA1-associated protein 2-domain-containing protein n=1 Tax=Lipomyces tetrasporus TaxID=54092 RepID=A0AAD7QUJ2_9ASCO|nr:BRCA1-associated protein 2-domain-containing protein [Lipomyces tetrasporus]KAJ8101553.1 BRCA1-associated protein 2-domain-containing protein [Lipomyces tetrasporus]